MLRSRVLTALIALPPLLAVLAWGPGWLISIIFLAIALLSWREYLVIVGRPPLALAVIGGLTVASLLALVWLGRPDLTWLVIPPTLIASALAALVRYRAETDSFHHLERFWLGLTLIVTPLVSLAALTLTVPHGRLWLLWLLAVVFGADTGAYFAGRKWGKAKLYPQVSPGKTRAGAWGGLAVGGLVGLIGGALDGSALDLLTGTAMGLTLAALSMVGDLLISLLKRTYHTKDSGSILPGHGGLLDRLDSFTLAAPALYALLAAWEILGG